MILVTDQVLPENQDQNYIYGMLAFPLLELGKMDEAERAARKGLAINKNDVWSQHNVCSGYSYSSSFILPLTITLNASRVGSIH
jgi:hypothetical protein